VTAKTKRTEIKCSFALPTAIAYKLDKITQKSNFKEKYPSNFSNF